MRRQRNRSILFASILLMVLAVVMSVVSHTNQPTASAGSKQITVEVIHKDGTQADFSYATDKEFLGELLVEEGLISGDKGPYGIYVSTVDGETADFAVDGGWWQLSQDGESVTVGADTLPITDGSTYTWAYTLG